MTTLLSNTNYYSNAIIGTPMAGADIDLYASNSAPKFQVGFGFTRADGNKYRYCQFGDICNRSTVVAPVTSVSDQANLLKAGALVANLTAQGNESMNPNAIGSRYAQLLVSASANQFAGAYLTVHSGTGFGFSYRIKGNDTVGAKVSGNTFFNLYDPIQVALDSNSEISITGCRYTGLTPCAGQTATAICVSGVTVSNNSANSYGWICTGGVTPALQDASIAASGREVYVSTTTAGAVAGYANIQGSNPAFATIGYMLEPGTSANYSVIFLRLE